MTPVKRSFKKERISGKTGNKGKKHNKKDFNIKQPAHAVPELIRLNKYIAQSGLCSRREADEYIKKGLIKVNGEIISEVGTKIHPKDKVIYNDKLINPEKPVYVLLNKPKDFITTLDDPHASKRVIDLVKNACSERIYPVGRLDRNTTGVLLFTNDGDLTKKLTHPKYNKKKIYQVWLDKVLKGTDMQKMLDGIKLDDGDASVDAIKYIDSADKTQVGLEIHSGKNRIVRRLFEQLGYKVKKLDRVYFAGLTKKNLRRGKWRFLSEKEITMLKMGSYE
ncbi:MAG: rRNA pseudouridine synthase [Chlorobi bacterium]|nr:rRNA pseudouridine synthase [Chlorobiota bacterium]